MRLFVATWPPPALVERLAAIPQDPGLRARWVRPDQWHVTLRFVGRLNAGEMPELTAALDRVGRAGAPATATAGPETACFGRHILHLPVAGLDRLASSVIDETRHLGAKVKDEPYNGHITLARTRRSRGGRPRGADLRALAGIAVDGSWPVEEISLVRSHAEPGGSRYEVLHRVPLAGV